MKNEIFFMITDMALNDPAEGKTIELYKTGIIPQASLQMNSAMSAYRVNKADFLTLLDSQMTLYRYEFEYHQAITEYEKNVANLEAAVGKRFFEKGEGEMKRLTWLILIDGSALVDFWMWKREGDHCPIRKA